MDTLHINSTMSLDNFTFGVPTKFLDSRWASQAQLGLGHNSSLLQMLKQTNRISSRVYSMFWGLVGGSENQRTPGALILGGLDTALIGQRPNYTGALNWQSDCLTGMVLDITAISLNFPNGSNASVMGSETIKACIVPGQAGLLRLPPQHWEPFQKLAGGTFPGGKEARSRGIDYWTVQYEPDHV